MLQTPPGSRHERVFAGKAQSTEVPQDNLLSAGMEVQLGRLLLLPITTPILLQWVPKLKGKGWEAGQKGSKAFVVRRGSAKSGQKRRNILFCKLTLTIVATKSVSGSHGC